MKRHFWPLKMNWIIVHIFTLTGMTCSLIAQEIPSNFEAYENQRKEENPEIFKVVQEMPRFPGCEEMVASAKEKEECAKETMLNYIYEQLIYPVKAKEEETEGMAVIQFVINSEGTIVRSKILRDPGDGCGEEVLRIVESMNHMTDKWIPGKQWGRSVWVQYTLPVKFKLKDKKPETRTRKFSKTGLRKERLNSALYDQEAVFPGCPQSKKYLSERLACAQKGLEDFIVENQLYPELAIRNGTEGTAIIRFRVKKNGKIDKLTVLKDPGDGLGEEAKNLIQFMNEVDMRWTPARSKGQDVDSYETLEIDFNIKEWQARI